MRRLRAHGDDAIVILLGIGLLWGIGCGGGGGGGEARSDCTGCGTPTAPAPVLAQLVLAPASATLSVGETLRVTVTATDSRGAAMPTAGVAPAWTTSNANVITVVDGTVTARTEGAATVTAAVGTVQGSATFTVTPVSPTPSAVPTIRLASATGGGTLASPLLVDDTARVIVSSALFDASGQSLAALPTGFSTAWSTSATGTATVSVPAGGTPLLATVAGQRGGVAMLRVTLLQGATVVSADSVTVRVRQVPATLTLVSGRVDTSVVGSTLAAPVVTQMRDRFGGADSNAAVAFELTGPGGRPGQLSAAQSTTNALGQASTMWTLSTASGSNGLKATVVGAPGLSAAANSFGKPDVPAGITVLQGDAQTGATGAELHLPAYARVEDRFGNAVPSMTTTWTRFDVSGATLDKVSATSRADGTVGPYAWPLTDNGGTQTLVITSGAATRRLTATARVPARIQICDPAGNCYADGASLPWRNDSTLLWGNAGYFSGVVKVWDAAAQPIPYVPIAIQGGGSATARTRIPMAETPTRSLIASANRAFVKRLESDDIIDIRGAGAGQFTVDVGTADPVTPPVGARYTAALLPLEPNMACAWAIQVVSAPATYPTMKVGQSASFRAVPSNCGPPFVPGQSAPSGATYSVENFGWTGPLPAGIASVSITGGPDVPTFDIVADGVGATTVSFQIDYWKLGLRVIDKWQKSQQFPPISITVTP